MNCQHSDSILKARIFLNNVPIRRGVHPRGNDARCVIEIWGTAIPKFGQLILRKIIKIVAARCHILRLKCTKFDIVWGSPQAQLGSSQRSPRPSSWIQGVLLLREGTEKGEGGREERGRGGRGKGGRGRRGLRPGCWKG